MADINIDGIVTWLKNWFYDKTEITGFLNNKANQSDLQTTNSNLSNLSSTVDNKVDKITGKGLSTEDYSTSEKDKLAGIEAEANKTIVDSALSSTSENPLQNKAINSALDGKAPKSHASSASTYGLGTTSSYGHVKTINGLTQASHSNGTALAAYQGKVLKDLIDSKSDFSGSYNDLTDKPSIPSKTSDLTNDGDGTNVFVKNNDSRLSDARTPTTHTHSTEEVRVGDELLENAIGQYLGANPTQSDINEVVDYLLGQVTNIKAVEIVTTLPTASSSTMHKIYILSESSKVNVYYTRRTGADPNFTYEWQKMDADILDELSIDWSDIENKPSTFTPATHAHGNIGMGGVMTDTPVATINGGYLLMTNDSSNIIKRTQYIYSGFMKSVAAYANLGTASQASQYDINGAINTAIGTINTSLSSKGSISDDVDWSYSENGFTNGIKLVDKTTNANGRIVLHLKS